MRSIFEDYASRDPITGNFLITYSDIGPILKNLQPYLPEKFTVRVSCVSMALRCAASQLCCFAL